MQGVRRNAARSSRVGQQRVEQRPVAGVVDLRGQVLEEAVELVHVAVGDGQERLDRHVLGAFAAWPAARRMSADLDHEVVAEALDAADHGDEVAALEAAGQHVGVPEGAGLHAARAVAQLERQICASSAGLQPVLAHAREDPADLVAGAQRADRAVQSPYRHDVR